MQYDCAREWQQVGPIRPHKKKRIAKYWEELGTLGVLQSVSANRLRRRAKNQQLWRELGVNCDELEEWWERESRLRCEAAPFLCFLLLYSQRTQPSGRCMWHAHDPSKSRHDSSRRPPWACSHSAWRAQTHAAPYFLQTRVPNNFLRATYLN